VVWGGKGVFLNRECDENNNLGGRSFPPHRKESCLLKNIDTKELYIPPFREEFCFPLYTGCGYQHRNIFLPPTICCAEGFFRAFKNPGFKKPGWGVPKFWEISHQFNPGVKYGGFIIFCTTPIIRGAPKNSA